VSKKEIAMVLLEQAETALSALIDRARAANDYIVLGMLIEARECILRGMRNLTMKP